MGELEVYNPNQDVALFRAPEVVLGEAQKAAIALKDVVSKKTKPVMMNGEQYLEFEDWQTVARFFGVTAKVIDTSYIEYGTVQGFEARAVAIRMDGMEVSAAEAMCLNDEPNWKSKPLFQLRSMAQTRACAKALRNVLAWVVVLAGYRPTPAEEIKDMADGNGKGKAPMKEPQKKSKEQPPETVTITVKEIDHKDGTNEKTKEPYRLYKITAEDGTVYGTFSDTFADMASTAKQAGGKVTIEYHAGKYGNTIRNLQPVETDESAG